jgi:DNA-binding CsgD family transcriptional regulator
MGVTAPCIGRWPELAVLDGAAGVARARHATVAAVRGELGMGKTTLLAEVRRRAAAAGCRVLATQGRAADAELGFASLLTLLRPVEDELDDLAGDLVEHLRAALALGRRPADPVAVRLGVLRVIGALAARQPLLVTIDDADLLDLATAEVLTFALGRLGADPVLTLIATDADAPSRLDELVTTTVVLDPLPDAELAELLAATTDLAPEPQHRCIALARGNPLAAQALALALDPDQRRGAAPLPPVPRAAGSAVTGGLADRLATASEASRRALAVVAADDTGDRTVVVSALSRLGEPTDGLDDAEASGLLRITGDRLELAHPLLRPLAYHQVAPASRRAAHRALAAALDAPHQGAARAWQLVAAADGPDDAVAASLTLVADDIARRGGLASAARTYECAAALSLDPAAQAARRVEAGRRWLEAGDAVSAARVATTLPATTADAEVLAFRSLALRSQGPGPTPTLGGSAEVQAVHALDLLELGDRDAAAGAARAARGSGALADLAAAAVLAATGHEPATALAAGSPPPPDRSTLGIRARALAAAVCVDAGLAQAAVRFAGPARLAIGGPELDLAVTRARALLAGGDAAGAAEAVGRLDSLAPAAGPGRVALDLARAEIALRTGDLTTAVQVATAVASATEPSGWWRTRAEAVLGRATLAAGRSDDALEHLTVAARAAVHLHGADLIVAALAAGRTALADTWVAALRPLADHPDPAVAVRAHLGLEAAGSAPAGAAVTAADAAGLPFDAVDALLAAVEAAHRAGDLAAAAAGAVEVTERLGTLGVRSVPPRMDAVVPGSSASPATILAGLTPAERRVAVAVAEGRTNQEAADDLFLSVKTVDFHLQGIYRKLQIRSRTELAVLVERSALVRAADGGAETVPGLPTRGVGHRRRSHAALARSGTAVEVQP